ncbi:hypothetical protein REPUB_Repub15cG0105300 [Reevesia pubescens]
MGCECDNYVNGTEADNPPFSIRQFVVATRRKDIFQCWPFPQKYLQICLKYGISNILPPFETCKTAIETTTETGGLACSQQDQEHVSSENKVRDTLGQDKLIRDDYNSYHDEMFLEAPCHDSIKSHWDDSCKQKDERNLRSDYTSNAIVPQEQSPLEDLYRTRCNSINIANDVDESSRLIAHVEDIKDDDEAGNDCLSSKKSKAARLSELNMKLVDDPSKFPHDIVIGISCLGS